MRHLFFLLAAALFLVACTSNVEPEAVESTVEPIPATTTPVEPAPPESTDDDVVTEDDLVAFIAAVETAIEGSSNEGLVFQAPEIFIANAQSFCARFETGDSLEVIVDDYLTEFAGTTLATASADDALLVASILGAGVETMCPQHGEKL